MSDHDSARELRDLVDERVRAVREHDTASLAAMPADDVLIFDVLPPLSSRGSQAQAEHTQAWFDGYAEGPTYDVEQVHADAAGDLGYVTFLYHVGGTLTSGDEVDMWVRATLVCRRVDGRWRVVHDHESVPFDPETGRALIDLAPDAAADR